MKKAYLIVISLIFSIIYSQSVQVKDSDDNSLFTIIDAGTTGDIGIGTSTPSASLQINGTTKFGIHTNVLTITDIIELTGITESTGGFTIISYPDGWNYSNTRVLCCEIDLSNSSKWRSLGYLEVDYIKYNSSVSLEINNIIILYNDISSYQLVPFRLVLMKVS